LGGTSLIEPSQIGAIHRFILIGDCNTITAESLDVDAAVETCSDVQHPV